jgi:alpha-tubulin suppressor-like RCC1 family protein
MIGAQVELTGIATLSAGSGHTCARTGDNTVSCWGRNDFSQTGFAAEPSRATPSRVPGILDVAGLAAGAAHTCVVQSDRTVQCWGANDTLQLGDASFVSRFRETPSAVMGLTGVAQLAPSQFHSCARLADGTARCWGGGSAGQLGNGTTPTTSGPVAVTGLTSADAVVSGQYHSCALLTGRTVVCWGANTLGQLGLVADTVVRASPVAVPGLSNVVELAAGESHTCARLADGTVRCWGSGAAGQLGVSASTATPTTVPGLRDVAEIATGASHTCARLADGTVQCWGLNAFGQCGDGTTANHTAPAPALGVAGARQIVAGLHHTCALFDGGVARCWGRTSEGALGDGVAPREFTNVPVDVVFPSDAARCSGVPTLPGVEVCGNEFDEDCDGVADTC